MPYKNKNSQREYQRLWVLERRGEYLLDKKCVRCGASDNLEVHHKDPNTKISHRIWSWSRERRNAELRKCEVLCRDCHIIHHKEVSRERVKHGSITMYSKYGCRCESCKGIKRERNRLRYK